MVLATCSAEEEDALVGSSDEEDELRLATVGNASDALDVADALEVVVGSAAASFAEVELGTAVEEGEASLVV